jgi:diguanylate cyclase
MFDRARRALTFLEHHQLEPDVGHYRLALAYAGDPGSALAREVARMTDGGLRLTIAQAATLSARYCDGAPHQAVEQREEAIARRTEELGTLTSEAASIARSIGDDVGTVVRHADQVPGGGDIVSRLSTAERELVELRQEFAKIQSAILDQRGGGGSASHDTLTNSLNQMGAREIMDRVVSQDRIYVMAMFAVDGLIAINRTYGSSVGDNVINAVASKLRTVFDEQEVIRWTGNEFIVVLADTTVKAARLQAEEVLMKLEARRFKLRGTGESIGVITASAGIIVSHGGQVDDMLEELRAKVAHATLSGGNRVEG